MPKKSSPKRLLRVKIGVINHGRIIGQLSSTYHVRESSKRQDLPKYIPHRRDDQREFYTWPRISETDTNNEWSRSRPRNPVRSRRWSWFRGFDENFHALPPIKSFRHFVHLPNTKGTHYTSSFTIRLPVSGAEKKLRCTCGSPPYDSTE